MNRSLFTSSRTPRATALRLVALSTLPLVASCVSRPQYEDSNKWAHDYQIQALEAQDRIVQLEGQIADLQSRLRSAGATTDASFGGDAEMEARINDLKSRIAGLGRPMGDIERFDVDGGYVYLIQDKVLFDLGSYDMGSDGRTALLDLARTIQATPHGRVIVRGHTDNVPIAKPETKARLPYGNLQLSAMRAVSVADLLIQKGGLDGKDVVVAGYGMHRPVTDNSTADKRRQNRRVEIFVEDPR